MHITLTEAQAAALLAFVESFETHITGAWPAIKRAMREDWGIDDPEAALEDAVNKLRDAA